MSAVDDAIAALDATEAVKMVDGAIRFRTSTGFVVAKESNLTGPQWVAVEAIWTDLGAIEE